MENLPEVPAQNKRAPDCEDIRSHGEIISAARTILGRVVRIGGLLTEVGTFRRSAAPEAEQNPGHVLDEAGRLGITDQVLAEVNRLLKQTDRDPAATNTGRAAI